MNATDFDKLVGACCEEIRETLSMKGQDYAGLTDRLQNFKDASAMNGPPAPYCLWGMVTKHIIALKEYIKLYDIGGMHPVSEKEWLEKMGDIMCYLVLLRGLLVDEGQLPKYASRVLGGEQ